MVDNTHWLLHRRGRKGTDRHYRPVQERIKVPLPEPRLRLIFVLTLSMNEMRGGDPSSSSSLITYPTPPSSHPSSWTCVAVTFDPSGAKLWRRWMLFYKYTNERRSKEAWVTPLWNRSSPCCSLCNRSEWRSSLHRHVVTIDEIK